MAEPAPIQKGSKLQSILVVVLVLVVVVSLVLVAAVILPTPSVRSSGAGETSDSSSLLSTSASSPSSSSSSPLSSSSAPSSSPFQVCTPLSERAEALNNYTILHGTNSPSYNEQLWFGFSRGSPSITYNVTALAQNDTYGYGPAYLVNGLSTSHYWYQAGIAWNWGVSRGTAVEPGFHFFYEVWNAQTVQSVFPRRGGSGSLDFSQAVEPGDNVLISLSFANDSVLMSGHDWRSGGVVSISYPAFGSRDFVGSNQSSRFPTSLLTEWYHVLPYFCSDRVVRFTSATATGSAWLAINEWNFTAATAGGATFNSTDTSLTVFSVVTPAFSFSSPSELISLGLNGTAIYCDPHTFVTM